MLRRHELVKVLKHMFGWKALVYRMGTMAIKFGWGLFYGWMWGHTSGSLGMVTIMILNEFVWYGYVEHRHGTDVCPECGRTYEDLHEVVI